MERIATSFEASTSSTVMAVRGTPPQVGTRVGPLIDRDLCGGDWVVAEFSGVSVGDQRVSSILAEVT